MKTIYMADLDGTLVDSSEKLSDYTVTTLNALIKRGLNFTLNTSRTPESVMPVIKEIDFALPVILMNGAAFYDTQKGKITYLRTLESAAIKKVLETARGALVNPFLFNFDGSDVSVQYISATSKWEKEFISAREGYYKEFKRVRDFTPSTVPYIVCVGSRKRMEDLKAKMSFIKDISASLFANSQSDYCFLEIYASTAGKDNGAKQFVKEYRFDRLVAFGDNLNDLDFIKNADLGICVANGMDETKKAADLVIGDVSDNAVAEYILIEWSREI